MVVQIQSSFALYCNQILAWIFQNSFIQSNPIALVFFVSAIPSIFFPIPKSEFFIPLLTNGGDVSAIIIASTAGNIIGEIFLYYLAKHGSGFLKRKEQKRDIEIKHFVHKYSWLFFLLSPFVLIGTDILVIFAGLRRVKLHHFIVQMSLGFAIKNIIVVLLVLQGYQLFPQILKLCNSF